jgi:hypothetical protein
VKKILIAERVPFPVSDTVNSCNIPSIFFGIIFFSKRFHHLIGWNKNVGKIMPKKR